MDVISQINVCVSLQFQHGEMGYAGGIPIKGFSSEVGLTAGITGSGAGTAVCVAIFQAAFKCGK